VKLALALLVALQPLLDRAAAYVEQYKHDFALVISDEDYLQRLSGRDAKLKMWVPARMRETYVDRAGTRNEERIECTATYSNFRRFETSARIVQ
jgi:hypothetical protein